MEDDGVVSFLSTLVLLHGHKFVAQTTNHTYTLFVIITKLYKMEFYTHLFICELTFWTSARSGCDDDDVNYVSTL